MCDGVQCFDLMIDNLNCGECGKVCENDLGRSSCYDGVCGPIGTPCFGPGDFANCNEACAAYGKECRGGPATESGCGDQPLNLFSGDYQMCDGLNGPPENAGCADAIDWHAFDYLDKPVTGARCCCAFE